MEVCEAVRVYNIPPRTLKRYLATGKSKVALGRKPVFTEEQEKTLVVHIKKLEKVGFVLGRKDIKEMAYQFAITLDMKHAFSQALGKAGNAWFSGFLKRNPELSHRKPIKSVSQADIQEFFILLAQVYDLNDISPDKIFYMDEIGIHIHDKPETVHVTRAIRDIHSVSNHEDGENVTVIACCNSEGNFLPPVIIYKGTDCNPQYTEGLPTGSQAFMNEKSADINPELFMKWFEEIYLPSKGAGKALLVMDGHSSHSNNIRLLEMAKANNVTILCFPSAIQPLDIAFFRLLKVCFAEEANTWMDMNKKKKITMCDVSKLIGLAWEQSATASNGVSAFRFTGIYPFDPLAIHATIQDLAANEPVKIKED